MKHINHQGNVQENVFKHQKPPNQLKDRLDDVNEYLELDNSNKYNIIWKNDT